MIYNTLTTLLADSPSVSVSGLRGASPAWLAANLAEHHTCCCIVPDEHLLSIFEQDLHLFSGRQVLVYPGHEIPPYTPLSPDQLTTASRLSTLYRLKEGSGGIMVTSIEALLRRIMPAKLLTSVAEYLMVGEDCDQDDLLHKLTYLGYDKVALVQSVGDFSVRGGIIDIYPPPFIIEPHTLHEGPVRLDFFGDTVESLRSFDPFTQRSTEEISEATLLPVTDLLFDYSSPKVRENLSQLFSRYGEKLQWNSEETASLMEQVGSGRRFAGMEFFLPLFFQDQTPSSSSVLDFLPKEAVVLMIDPEGIHQSMDITHERIMQNYQTALDLANPALPPEMLFLTKDEITRQLAGFKQLRLTDFPRQNDRCLAVSSSNHQLLKQDISLKRAKTGLLAPLSEQIYQWQAADGQVIVCCRSSRHTKNLAELLSKHHHQIEIIPSPLNLDQFPEKSAEQSLYLCDHPLSQGFSLSDSRLHILSESELFGEMRLGGKTKKKATGEPLRFTELHDGDIVVHRDHGLGIYRGLSTIALQSIINDFMLIEYRDGDKLYLPVDRLNLITRYQGLSDRAPKIDKLGTQNWKTTTAKVKEEVWKVAQELLHIYATREIREGRQFSPPGALFHELEESFDFDETPGQEKSINDVIDDLTSDRPMDRLVCGDVGYGKTEVAVRAAFKVVEDGYQVAVLVPTTVLAEQHAKTFAERLHGFPVNIGCLNRFRTAAEQRAILKELKNGGVDIVIGTHRLLSKDVVFQNLGLLVIDEEHRFGVAHKEKLKKLRAEVDILTLTATPIPRTLQMSLLSIRDLSVISTPPEHRQPVKTFVARYDDLVIKEAVTKEIRRGGQVFFVHNRVKSIHKMAALIQKLVPEAKIAVAHGQMAGKELEDIMVSFIKKRINVLVSTTIIESGLDIPSANTIIINRADMLGLAEIYQLRGRVGRSSTQSFAYLLVPSLDSLSKDSRDRLRALMDCNELGGGFKLAMSDLQIRGGGNILGVSQSGNIAAIGYDLYLDLLQKTVADLKAQAASGQCETVSDDLDPEINLQLSAYIPDSYIPDISQRYITYRRMAALAGSPPEMQLDLQDELVDRYGPLPVETSTLFRIISLKKGLAALRINKLEQGRDSLVFTFQGDTPLSAEMLLRYLQHHTGRKNSLVAKLTPDSRLVLNGRLSSIEHIFDTLDTTLEELTTLAHAAH
ncbi:transcription-repair coupling factor [Desulfopila sp. IMCC35006]|uniref:transcription-repair coupling factor n=1 Tax=Desulfopila sp. IMCC35006 TaxID=2569542 RepID=UPI0010AD04E2|nr:transcription-repair coupling factor [Desulfopila sp. IMCC35006]TKB24850.1 transcription-repair coupling factor [Desulfopila sp. IMCC35006]